MSRSQSALRIVSATWARAVFSGLQGRSFPFGVGEKAAQFLAMRARAGELARPSPVGRRSQGFGDALPQVVEAGSTQLLGGREVLGRGRSQQVADGRDERVANRTPCTSFTIQRFPSPTIRPNATGA